VGLRVREEYDMATGIQPEAPSLSDGQPSGRKLTAPEGIAMVLQVMMWSQSPYEFHRKRAQALLVDFFGDAVADVDLGRQPGVGVTPR
jgi:hypothetical protein